tara:strand:+ start:37599 stop:37745 length:147 start_codon:yes stop_codon:yes gene_type:complete
MQENIYEELTFELSTYTVDDKHVYHVSTLDGETIAIIDKLEDWGFNDD